MCGIFGLVAPKDSTLSPSEAEALLSRLYLFSESRGKESAGIHVYLPASGKAWTLKSAEPASKFIRSKPYKQLMESVWKARQASPGPIAIIAHSRLVTNGRAEDARNNQPVHYGDVGMVHNGIIVNVDALWKAHPELQRHAEVDTEIAAALMSKATADGAHPAAASMQLLKTIRGAASVAWVHGAGNYLMLATNTGDLFYASDAKRCFTFASERYILNQALQEKGEIRWVQPPGGLQVALEDVRIANLDQPLALTHGAAASHVEWDAAAKPMPVIASPHATESLLRYNASRLAQLKRCTRCILPDTFPFISFDEQGVCSYCRNYRPKYQKFSAAEAKKQFLVRLEKYRRAGGVPDAIVPFSGGRDSSYGLHLIQREFGFKPITFTYDWGMLTDLARRNIARMCGQLGIQNILVSADLKWKRDNIRRNVSAWLHKPDLGMVPLFMAGDKHFFTVVNQLKKQTGINLDLWCANPLENTDFKSGFCGVEPDFEKKRLDYLSGSRKARMAAHYLAQFARNPRYLNASLMDTFTAFWAYYFEPRNDFYFIFDHLVWNEDEVNETLVQYDWERSPDTPSTWRIGDGTAPFYNYIYVTARGFSEFDTFRSNQIREGQITREEALRHVLAENAPRTMSLRWYLETIGLDFDATIRRINELDTMGLHA